MTTRRRRAAPPRARPADRTATGSAPAPRTSPSSRVAQIRSSARIGDARGQPIVSARWWKTSRAVTTPVGRPSCDDRDVAEPADGHLVDGDRDRVVVAEDDRVGGHEVADLETVERLPGDLHHGIAVGEDPDEPVVDGDEDAVGLGVLHPGDRGLDRRLRGDGQRRRCAELVEVLTEQPAVEGQRRLRDVRAGQVRATVVADLRSRQVLESHRPDTACRRSCPRASRPSRSRRR